MKYNMIKYWQHMSKVLRFLAKILWNLWVKIHNTKIIILISFFLLFWNLLKMKMLQRVLLLTCLVCLACITPTATAATALKYCKCPASTGFICKVTSDTSEYLNCDIIDGDLEIYLSFYGTCSGNACESGWVHKTTASCKASG